MDVTCNGKNCTHNKEGKCECKELHIEKYEYFDMNPYDVSAVMACTSYERK